MKILCVHCRKWVDVKNSKIHWRKCKKHLARKIVLKLMEEIQHLKSVNIKNKKFIIKKLLKEIWCFFSGEDLYKKEYEDLTKSYTHSRPRPDTDPPENKKFIIKKLLKEIWCFFSGEDLYKKEYEDFISKL